MSDAAVLSVTDLRVSYGGVHAVDGLTLDVRPGSLTGLIGPNGAGKTSAIDAITGFTHASGRVQLEGRDVSRSSAHRRARLGLRRTWQSLELFDDLTVEQNLLASRPAPAWAVAKEILLGRSAQVPPYVDALVDRFELGSYRHETVTNLSQGHRKIVTIARAMASEPAVLLLDEPAAGLDSTESRWLRDHLVGVAASGTAILLVEHDMDLVLSACHHVYVLDFGRLIADGTPAEVSRDPAVTAAYLGSPAVPGGAA